MLIGLNGSHPRSPPASPVGIWPTPIRLQNPSQPNDPWGGLDIHKRDLGSHEIRAAWMGCCDEQIESILKFLGIFNLFLWVLLLKHPIEVRYNISVDLLVY